jgi:hypothetical protein
LPEPVASQVLLPIFRQPRVAGSKSTWLKKGLADEAVEPAGALSSAAGKTLMFPRAGSRW